MAVRTIEIGSGAVDRRKWMYTDSEMSFFGRENLRNSAFQRGKSFFYSFVQKELLCSLCGGLKFGHFDILDMLFPFLAFVKL